MRELNGSARTQYDRMRQLAFEGKPSQIMSAAALAGGVAKVIMEFVHRGDFVTLMCTVIGDASVYISSGQFIIGGFERREVREESQKFVDTISRLNIASPASGTFSLPALGYTKIYWLRVDGHWREITFISGSLDLSPIENAGHRVIVCLGEHTR